MRYRVADIPALARTPVGRRILRNAVVYQSWPLLRSLAATHRMTIARRTRLVAVVGSLGKTTTARAVLAALTGNVDPEIAENYTSFVAAAVLRIRPGDRYAVLEIGIDRHGQMTRYARLVHPDIAVVTSIASEHNRSLGPIEAAREEKAEMVRALPRTGLAVLNGDDPHVRWMAGETRARVITFGLNSDNDVRASGVSLDWPYGTRLTLHGAGPSRDIRVRLIGRRMTHAVLAAVAVAHVEGRDLDTVIQTLEQLAPTPLRLEPVPLPNGGYLLRDEFKSTLESVHTALDVLAEIPARRRVVVLGDVSEPPLSQGPMYADLGRRIARIADAAVFVGRAYPRYATGARRAGMPAEALVDVGRSARRAVEALRGIVEPGDVILCKGRDTQKLDRIALALLGHDVRCDVAQCYALERCGACPMLERGWNGLRAVV